jgi:hypothetical protein
VLQVFEELLLDADWALNAGNWMWLSASAFFHQYFRLDPDLLSFTLHLPFFRMLTFVLEDV